MIFSEPLADACIYKVKGIVARGETVAEGFIERVRHAQSANQATIEMLVCDYQTPAIRVAQNILGDLLEAEDAVQDAWLLALRNIASFQNPALNQNQCVLSTMLRSGWPAAKRWAFSSRRANWRS